MLASLRRTTLLATIPALVVVNAMTPSFVLAAPKVHRKAKAATKPADPADKPTDTKPVEPAPEPKPDASKVPPPPPTTAPASVGTASGTGGGGGGTTAGGTTAGGAGAAPAEPPPPANEPDVDSLRQEYLSLRDELFNSRARAHLVASQLYSTHVTIHFTWTSARYYGVTKASIRLDGANVYDQTGAAIANDDGIRFESYVAPGRHLVTFHVEASGKDDDSFTSSTETQVVVKAVANKDLVVAAKARDSGDIAYEWKRSEHGNYGLGIDVAVKTVVHPAEAAPAKDKAK